MTPPTRYPAQYARAVVRYAGADRGQWDAFVKAVRDNPHYDPVRVGAFADFLDEAGHPLAGMTRWREAGRGIEVDRHLHDHVSRLVADDASPHAYHREMSFLAAYKSRDFLRAKRHVRRHVPGVTDDDIYRSAHRLQFFAAGRPVSATY